MRTWNAVSFGALDMREWDGPFAHVDFIVLPIYPLAEPLGLVGPPAVLWQRLLEGQVSEEHLSSEELELILDFEHVGIATSSGKHSNHIVDVCTPWLSSPLHELVYALVQSIASDAKIDVIFVKGPILRSQGLRTRFHSGDVDVWVRPSQLECLVKLMEPWGWKVQPGIWQGTKVNHSTTLSPDRWGCELDIHEHFPGVALDSEEAFDRFATSLTKHEFASVDVEVPSMECHAIIQSLHVLRPNFGTTGTSDRVLVARDTLMTAGAETIRLARELGASAVLHEPLSMAFPEHEFSQPEALPDNWVWRGKKNRVFAYCYALRMVPLRMRPLILFRFIFPSRAILLESERIAGGSASNWFSLWCKRLARGVKPLFSNFKTIK
ncbi:nucleotidyltransferase family protein [Glutamicibacter uratoxydans]|uniref:nucleotidyltransferase family protein n=1 Tax=Glutamicibacter uratoxydans TaxID=43667 RepID=UPI0011412F70|nr:nucleotidyltransferase family protein [Glutamicibacter uratoxydans]